jgi:hypothetical protein
MNRFQNDEYTQQVMDVVRLISGALSETEFDIGTNALLVMLAEAGKQSTLTTEEFLAATVVQIKYLMDNMTVIDSPLQ